MRKSFAQCSYSLYRSSNYHLLHSRQPYATSALYIPHGDETNATVVQVDPDFDRIFKDVKLMRLNLEKRNTKGVDLDSLVVNYNRMMELFKARIELLEKREETNMKMKEILKKKKKDSNFKEQKAAIIAEGLETKEALRTTLSHLWPLEEAVILDTLKLPNFPASDTPDTDVVMHSFGTPGMCKHSHVELASQHGLLQMSPVSPGAYYLLGDLAELELLITEKISALLHYRGFRHYHPPDFVKRVILEGYGEDFDDPEKYFTLRPKDTGDVTDEKVDTTLHLVGGAAYASWIAYFTKMTVQGSELPLKAFSAGRHYIPAVPSAQPSLMNVPQSNQISLFALTACASSSQTVALEYEDILREVYSALNVPHRIVRVSAERLRMCEAARVELQAWLPSEQAYCPVAEVGVCGDFVSRRLAIKCNEDLGALSREAEESNRHYMHMVHATVTNTAKLLAVLIENNSDHHKQDEFINYQHIADRVNALS